MQPILLLLLAAATFALANADNELVFSSKFKRDTAAQAGPVNPIAQTAMNKHKLNEELEKNVEGMRQGCFPRPRGVGCRCAEKDAQGHDLEKVFDTDAECKYTFQLGHQNSSDPIVQTAMNKHLLNEEFKQRVEGLREGCFPRPSGVGCRCTEKDAEGQDRERIFETDAECKKSPGQQREKREARVQQNVQQQQDVVPRTQQQQHKNVPVAGGGVDPVAERARQNYAAVLDELKNKFAGLREGCYPRPKGCLCVVGKDATGREVTERRMKDSDCKCAQGERSRDCPAASRGA